MTQCDALGEPPPAFCKAVASTYRCARKRSPARIWNRRIIWPRDNGGKGARERSAKGYAKEPVERHRVPTSDYFRSLEGDSVKVCRDPAFEPSYLLDVPTFDARLRLAFPRPSARECWLVSSVPATAVSDPSGLSRRPSNRSRSCRVDGSEIAASVQQPLKSSKGLEARGRSPAISDPIRPTRSACSLLSRFRAPRALPTSRDFI